MPLIMIDSRYSVFARGLVDFLVDLVLGDGGMRHPESMNSSSSDFVFRIFSRRFIIYRSSSIWTSRGGAMPLYTLLTTERASEGL